MERAAWEGYAEAEKNDSTFDGISIPYKETVTKAWKVYGRSGHRQRESFNESYKYDFSNEREGTRILRIVNSDISGTNDYSIIIITRNTEDDCIDEFEGQLTDGVYENSATGNIFEIEDETLIKVLMMEVDKKPCRD